MTKPRIAIIGAGISGIILARELQEVAQVKIFEKSRGVGGRMSTRYVEDFAFDHGAQCFTARTKSFQKFLQPFLLSNDVAPWHGKVINIENDGSISQRFWFETHLVAAPNMNSLCKKLAVGLDISLNSEVKKLDRKQSDGWHLKSKADEDLGVFDLVISTAPPAQTKNLFHQYFTCQEIFMQPCFALMLGFKSKWDRDWIFAKVRNNPIKLIAVNSSKFGRNNDVTSLVIHSRDSWSRENLERDQNQVQQILLENFTQVSSIDYKQASYVSLHRWRYALIDQTKREKFFNQDLGLAATSDWSTNSRIEDVWIAAINLVEKIKFVLSDDQLLKISNKIEIIS
ncbi:MAG: flavin containing amine oxidoreductase-like protein [Proteobacteria bacterium]|nr:flavin containing amine oxidoreductase-like protein [Pseudomonadota bacterium]